MDDTRGRITRDGIRIYDAADFAGMHAAGRVAAEILDLVGPLVVPGVTTGALDDFITAEVNRRGVTSATIGYRGYKHASCISVNHVVCHGIPGAPIPMQKSETISKDLEKRRKDDVLLDGDILNIDVTVVVDGWFGDTSRMYVAGKLHDRAKGLIKVMVVKGRPVGASIAGPMAGELIGMWAMALANKMKMSAIANTVLPYPTVSEINKRAAGAYFSPRLFENPTVKKVVGFVQRWLP